MRFVISLVTLLHLTNANPHDALTELYTSTSGQNWKNNQFWLSEESYCNWFGIECRDGVIVKIELPDNNLRGSLPRGLGYFTDLEVLNLKSNHISGSIPSQLVNLRKATTLNLENNQICGDISVELANEALFRNWNIVKENPLIFTPCINKDMARKLSTCTTDETVVAALESIYTELGGATWNSNSNWMDGCPCDNWYGIECVDDVVQAISLGKNGLAGSLPANLGDLMSENSEITDIDLCCNYITGSLPSGLGAFDSLDSLNLGNNMICGDIGNVVNEGNDDEYEYCLDNAFIYKDDFEIMGNSIGTACPTDSPTPSPTISLAPSPYECGMGGEGADALCPFYESTRGTVGFWTTATNWGTKRPCTNSWYGVTCENVGTEDVKVTAIKLNDNKLFGYINTEMGLLTDLEHKFNLQGNSLYSTIPSELGSYTGLTNMFGLAENLLGGTIPATLGGLTALTQLFNLQDNELTGSIPTELGKLTSMTSNFNIQRNNLDGAIPSELGEMTGIVQGFSVAENNLEESIPTELAGLTALTAKFNLQSNQLTGCIPSEFGAFTALQYGFDLKDNELSCTIPSELGLMTNIEEYFFLHSNKLTGLIPSEFGTWTKTNFHDADSAFVLKDNSLCGDIPDEVTALSQLNIPGHWEYGRWGSKWVDGCVDEDTCAAWEIVIKNSIGTPCP